MHIAHANMSLPSGGYGLLGGLTPYFKREQVALTVAVSVTFPLKIKRQNLQTPVVIQAGPHRGLTRGLCLQNGAVQSKATAFVVVAQGVVVAVHSEQYLMRADLQIFGFTLKLCAPKVVHQSVHQGAKFLLGLAALHNVPIAAPLQCSPGAGGCKQAQTQSQA